LAKDRFRIAASKQNPLSFDQKSTGLLIRRRVNSLPQVRILSSPLKTLGYWSFVSDQFPHPAFSIAFVLPIQDNLRMIRMLEKKWLTASEAAILIGCSTSRIRALSREGSLKAEKVGPRAWLVDKKSAEELAKTPAKTGRPRKSFEK
jgi:excisionase family DNA binding protein